MLFRTKKVYNTFAKFKNFVFFNVFLHKNEFHNSLSLDIDSYGKMNKEEKIAYDNELARKRQIAHNLDLMED